MKKLNLEDLHIGMFVEKEQLTDIYDTWVILTKRSEHDRYRISYIGAALTDEVSKLYADETIKIVCPVFNDSMLKDDYIDFIG